MAQQKMEVGEFVKRLKRSPKILKISLLNLVLQKKFADRVFDIVEAFIVVTKTKIDDTIGLPAYSLLRNILDIPKY